MDKFRLVTGRVCGHCGKRGKWPTFYKGYAFCADCFNEWDDIERDILAKAFREFVKYETTTEKTKTADKRRNRQNK